MKWTSQGNKRQCILELTFLQKHVDVKFSNWIVIEVLHLDVLTIVCWKLVQLVNLLHKKYNTVCGNKVTLQLLRHWLQPDCEFAPFDVAIAISGGYVIAFVMAVATTIAGPVAVTITAVAVVIALTVANVVLPMAVTVSCCGCVCDHVNAQRHVVIQYYTLKTCVTASYSIKCNNSHSIDNGS